ncbi:MAG TPA: OsmC family protein [Ilumatobacteraceae bacterium]|nr:OsmC family protein [Ilumatobacteraceae bacterium]
MAPDDHDKNLAKGAADDLRIGAAVTRLEAAVERRTGFGRATNTASITLVDGLRCCSEEGAWSIDTDLPTGLGGSGSAPTPGVLLRAALGSCLAMGYRLRAARRGIPVRSIRVTVESDSEIDGMLRATSTAPPGFTAIRYHVELDTSAPAETIEALVDEADQLSPILDAVGRANPLRRSLSIVDGAA